MRQLIFALCVVLFTGSLGAADLTSREKQVVAAVQATIAKAGTSYQSGDYEDAGRHIQTAMKQLANAINAGSPELYDALDPDMKRIAKAHTMLEFEGVSLPPFKRPDRPSPDQPKPSVPTPKKPEPEPMPEPEPKPLLSSDNTVSFSRQVAPILAGRCGRCHISDSKGRFNMATFAKLMEGPPEGVVIFAGDTVGSRLIETIETGDMPRGGRMPRAELEILKTWIKEGAKFDGTDKDGPLVAGASPAPMPQNTTRLQVRRATGKETVSFAGDVAPLLVENCNGCHLDAMQTRGGLRMDNFAGLLRGGDSGAVIVPGKGEESLLVQKLRGAVGERMPAGGRPALSEESIQLISKWIDEGATLDGASDNQPLRVMSMLAWAAKATPGELSEKRREFADKNMQLVSAAGAGSAAAETEHFRIIGTASQGTIDLVAKQAEEQIKMAKTVVNAPEGEAFFHGKATIFVMPRRYDYSEFAKMVESRSVPTEWSSHWQFNGIDAYVSLVATDRDEEEEIGDRLTSPIVALAVATRGGDVPRWLAEGVGTVVASRKNAQDREEKARFEAELSAAFATLDNAKKFLDEKMTPEHSDLIGAAIASTMLDRSYRRQFDGLLKNLSEGQGFEVAFNQSFGMPTQAFVTNWLKYVRGG